MKHSSRAAGIAHMLFAAGVASSEIGIYCSTHSVSSGNSILDQINALFAQTYAIPPLAMACRARGGRPEAYLTVAGSSLTARASSATRCMTGFNALLLAALVHQQIVTNSQSFVEAIDER